MKTTSRCSLPIRKPIYDPVIEFRHRVTRDRFAEMFLEVLRHSNPELFTEPAP
jgi:hypothetical protein